MPKRPDVGAIAEQVIERLKQIEDQVTQNQRIADELARLRDVVTELERAIVSRFSGEPVPAAEPTERAPRQRAAKRSRAPALRNARPHRAARTRARSSQRCREASDDRVRDRQAHGHLGRHRQYDPDEDGQERRADQGRARLPAPRLATRPLS